VKPELLVEATALPLLMLVPVFYLHHVVKISQFHWILTSTVSGKTPQPFRSTRNLEVEPATPSLQDVLYIGADEYETDAERAGILANGGVPIGIGENTVIRNAIIDKNARIGKNCHITNKDVSVKDGCLCLIRSCTEACSLVERRLRGCIMWFVCRSRTGLQRHDLCSGRSLQCLVDWSN
jgi:hypothetical protein